MNEERDQGEPSASQAGEAGAVEGPAPRLRLRSLKVHAFRDVRPGTELRFGDGFHLILGKNGTGKSTLLELLGAVSTLNFRRPFFAETPFHLEASLEIGSVALHIDLKRTFEAQRMGSRVAGQHIDFPPQDEAEMSVRADLAGVPIGQWLSVRTGEDLRIFQSDPETAAPPKSRSLKLPGGIDPLTFSVGGALSYAAMVVKSGTLGVHPEAWNSFRHVSSLPGTGGPFDEALGALHSMVGGQLTVVRGARFRSSSPWLPPPLDFAGQGEPVVLDLSTDPQLQRAVTCLGYESAKVYFGPGATINVGWAYSSPSFQFFRNGKAVRRHDQLSFGQQRLFSFAWYLACNPDVAIADELVNGLHSDWIDWCVEAIGDRQCFLTSQNPLLVDAVPLTSEEDVRRGIILCEIAPDSDQLTWRQLDAGELDIVSRALAQSRLDLLSDLLRALDLW